MDKNKKKKFCLFKILVVSVAVFCGITAYAYYFPTTMELIDDEINEILAMAEKEKTVTFFSDFSDFSKKLVNKGIYWFEVIKENIEGVSEVKPINGFIITCAAQNPLGEAGSVTSGFGERKDPFSGENSFHEGLDMAASFGSEVFAAWPGDVIETGFNNIDGNYVIIEHSEGFKSKYCHLSKIETEEECFLKCGEKIGEVGNTGRSTGSHLHFEVIIDGIKTDPAACFEI